MAKSKTAAQFISRLGKDAEFRLRVGPALLDIQEGDWSGIITVAKDAGYSFTKKQLIAAVPDSFFKGEGKRPDAGWDKKTAKVRRSKKAS